MNAMHPIELVVLTVGLVGFAVGFVVQFRLRRHVSADRVKALLDRPSDLYPNSIPPAVVLDDAGRRLSKIMKIGLGIFMASVVTMLVLAEAGIGK
jgi:hypothetical protein